MHAKSDGFCAFSQVGFKAKDIQYVPCSGLTGANLTEDKESRLQAWYKGGTLLQAIGMHACVFTKV